MLKGHILKFTMTIRVAHRAIKGVHGQVFLNGFLAGKKEVFPFGTNHHSRCCLRRARANRSLFAFLHHKAHPTGAERIECVVVTHRRDDLPCHGDDIVERHPVLCRDGFSVNAQFDACGFNVGIGRWL